jgi:hypothetical protein
MNGILLILAPYYLTSVDSKNDLNTDGRVGRQVRSFQSEELPRGHTHIPQYLDSMPHQASRLDP